MSVGSDLSVGVFGTTFQNPILLAAGTAGFGLEVADVVRLDRLGGLVTKAVSREPRDGHPGPRVVEFKGGMLNAVGLANPGLDHVLACELPWLASNLRAARVIVNVVGSSPADFVAVVERLSAVDVVSALELNLSCPNTEGGGQEFCADLETLRSLVSACRAVTGKPLIAKLPPSPGSVEAMAEQAAAAGADGFSLVNTLPGTLLSDATGRARLGFGQGGVSGPALLPLGVLATRRVRERTGLPVIGVGGVRFVEDVRQYLAAGASLVAIGTAALADPRVPERLVEGLARG